MRLQLGVPENTFLTPEKYNELFTLHGTTMVFLVRRADDGRASRTTSCR